MKKLIFLIILPTVLLLSTACTAHVLAVSSHSNLLAQNTADDSGLPGSAGGAAKKGKSFDYLKKKAIQIVEKKISKLEKQIKKIDASKKLTPQQKELIKSEKTNSINKLQDIKKKMQDAQNEDQLKAALLEMLAIPIDNSLAALSNLEELVKGIQVMVDVITSKGIDASNMQKVLDDIKAKVAEAKGILEKNKTDLMAKDPFKHPGKWKNFDPLKKDYKKLHGLYIGILYDLQLLEQQLLELLSKHPNLFDNPTGNPQPTGQPGEPSTGPTAIPHATPTTIPVTGGLPVYFTKSGTTTLINNLSVSGSSSIDLYVDAGTTNLNGFDITITTSKTSGGLVISKLTEGKDAASFSTKIFGDITDTGHNLRFAKVSTNTSGTITGKLLLGTISLSTTATSGDGQIQFGKITITSASSDKALPVSPTSVMYVVGP